MKRLLFAVVAAVVLQAAPAAAQYSMRRTPELVQLEDAAHGIVVAIAPSAGNLTREMTVKGDNILGPLGIPFLAPWANRLDEQAFYANGKRYALNMELGNVRGAHPIHGFLSAAAWEVVEAKADSGSAWVTSRLEFFRQPDWMAQFPFAHTIDMTHRLRDGVLDITVQLHNISAAPMPVAIGFHPYFRLTDAPRDAWTIALGARTEWVLADDKIPTGETHPIERRFPDPRAAALRDHDLDHVFGDLIRDASGRAAMSVAGRSQKIDVTFGPNYRAVVVYAPAGRDFICFEPMAGITDALNLAHSGKYSDLQYIPAGGTWKESFWIRPSGF
ncbi:MAG TPA: aldose 1-epimerase [Vicinamibacterales bacterium]|jgi:aldose 1-epimerase|nr:aldose 1-epimerase [Vicinamibacterales bacterium]